jgi:hypothetical protein
MFFVCVYPGTRSISSFFWNSRQRKCETYLFKLINNSKTNCNQQRETVISSSIQFNNRKNKQTLLEKNVDRVQHFWAIGISGTRCMAQAVYLIYTITFRKEERKKEEKFFFGSCIFIFITDRGRLLIYRQTWWNMQTDVAGLYIIAFFGCMLPSYIIIIFFKPKKKKKQENDFLIWNFFCFVLFIILLVIFGSW